MFRGEKINITENRAVLHVALRAPRGRRIVVDGENIVPDVHAVSTRWPLSPIAFEAASGKGTPENHSEYAQYWHRRLRPWAGDGLRSVKGTTATGFDFSFHLQCRRHRLCRGHSRS